MDLLKNSWGSFKTEQAEDYLNGQGHPSESSKQILVDVIKSLSKEVASPKILDIGCGNGQLLSYFQDKNLTCSYHGVDFSEPLLQVAKKNYSQATFTLDDVHSMKCIKESFDFAIYSHVIEALPSPEESLIRARQLAKIILIRFFEPPTFEHDRAELKEMNTGSKDPVPYLRRKMSASYYQMILSKVGCTQVEVYQDELSKDQIHVLHFP